MPLFLAGLLSRSGILPARLVEEALQRQVLAGGALDSSLLELGAIDEAQLGPFLSSASGLPLADPAQLAAPEQRLRRLFPLRLADRHGLVPFAQEDRTLKMACTYPTDAALLEEMSFLLSQRIEAWIAPEFRVRLAIERLYGHPASARMHELARRCGAENPAPAAPLAAVERPPSDPERCIPPGWTVADALSRLEAAGDRDEAIEVVLRFGRKHFGYVALFGVMGGNAVGWDAIGEEAGAEHRVEQVVQSLDEETVLATVVRTRGRYLGPLAHTDANRLLVERLGRELPHTAFVHPVEMGERLVALIYGENGAGEVSASAASEMMVVVQALGVAFERLVRERKAAAAETTGADPRTAAATPPAPEAAPSGAPARGVDGAGALPEVARLPAQDPAPAPAPAPPAAEKSSPSAAARGAAAAPVAPVAPGSARASASAKPAPAAVHPAAQSAASAIPAPPSAAPAATREAVRPARQTPSAARSAAPAPATASSAAPSAARFQRAPAVAGLQQACRGAEELLHACSDAERAEALARIAGAGSIGAEVLVALLPGPLRTDGAGNVIGGVILDALAALGPWAVPALARAASSPSSTVRYWVAVLLSSSSDPAGHAALGRLANDPDEGVAAIARTAALPAA